MPSLYDVSANGLLTEVVREIDEQQLEAQTQLAELLLGVTRVETDDTYRDIVELAIARQVRHQVSLGIDVNAQVLQSFNDGTRNEVYRSALSSRDVTAMELMGMVPGQKSMSERMGYINTPRSLRG